MNLKAVAASILVFMLTYGVWLIPLYFLLRFVVSSIRDKIKKAHDNELLSFVLQNSNLLKELQSVNAKYTFADIKQNYVFPYDCKSKSEYDRFDFYDYYCNLCYRKSKEFRTIKLDAEENQKKYKEYEMLFFQIMNRVDTDGLGNEYAAAERKALSDNKLTPIVEPCIIVKKTYSSPKGQNYYHAQKSYSVWEVEGAIKAKRDAYSANAKHKASVEYERSLMTPRLRYQVLRRDGFKCVLCGASSKDGVTLHVDHIKPVSKGGKSEISNLPSWSTFKEL